MNKRIRHNLQIKINDIHTYGRFTIVQLIDEKNREGIGIARRSELDTNLPNLAIEIARGRAEQALYLKKHGRKIRNIFMG